MFASQPETWADSQIVAVVELDMQKMRVRFVLAPEAIRERLLELECLRDHYGSGGASRTRWSTADRKVSNSEQFLEPKC